jgi:protein gp37
LINNDTDHRIADAACSFGYSCYELYRPAFDYGQCDDGKIDDIWCQLPLQNVWLGVSVEDQKTADERIPYLLASPAAVRWLSCEPLLGPINLRNVYDQYRRFGGELDVLRGIVKGQCHTTGRVDWVVVGGESGPNARPMNVGWLRSIVDQCKAASVPVFVKQLGSKPETFTNHGRVLNAVALKSKKGGDMGEWPEDLRVREYPGRSMEASA